MKLSYFYPILISISDIHYIKRKLIDVALNKMQISFILVLFVLILFQWSDAKNRIELDGFNSDSALMFTKKWIGTPKMYLGLILPTKSKYRINTIVSLLKKMASNHKDITYFLATTNITSYKILKSFQKDLLWLPFEFKHYHLDCQAVTFFGNNMKQRKHFLLFTGRQRNVNDYFGRCEIQFNSEIVVYYQHGVSKFLSGLSEFKNHDLKTVGFVGLWDFFRKIECGFCGFVVKFGRIFGCWICGLVGCT